MSKILIIRFSALGDVAMTIPVIYSFANKYPEHNITFLSDKGFQPLFDSSPDNVHFIGADLKNENNGIKGLRKLYAQLKQEKFDYVADFHSVLRTHFLRFKFRLDGITTAKIQKGRIEKNNLTRKNNKKFAQLKSSFTRYHDVLEKLGFKFELNFETIFANKKTAISFPGQKEKENGVKWIGIAPFAKHKGKIYPLELQEKVIAYFAKTANVKVILFGGGKTEKKNIQDWITKYPTVTSMVGQLNLGQEIMLMSQLDLMFSMDSANMHLASLVGTKVVSLWGATHPYAGFMGWNQTTKNAIQIDLPCRPCSIYGKKECYRKDYACLNQISPKNVIHVLEKAL